MVSKAWIVINFFGYQLKAGHSVISINYVMSILDN
jgi:hypothetical protein